MNLYVYNKQSLTFKKVSIKQYLYLILIIGFIFSGLGFTGAIKFNQLVEKIPVVIRLQEDEFSEENLKKEINNLGFKYPDIIYAQAVEETGRFKSPVFKQNNNLFGLKIPNLRPTLATGENLNHAKFRNWRESLIERAMWDIQNTNNIYSKQEYYQLLDAIYAEKPGYSDRLKQIK